MESQATFTRALVIAVPASMLLAGSLVSFSRTNSVFSFLQLVGAGCFVVVVLSHICEALHLFPGMGWGSQGSAGHYLDLTSTILSLALFPLGYLLHVLKSTRP